MIMPNKAISELTAEDVMTKRVVRVNEDASVMEAVKKLYTTNIGALAVVDENDRIIGIFTERDILRRVIPQNIKMDRTAVAKVMTASPMTASPETPLAKVYKTMSGLNFRHVPIVKDDKILGMISIKDIAKACMQLAAS
jgi:CBS domain-containing protein